MKLALLLILPMLATPFAAAAAARGTPEEARAMLDRAVAHYREVGRDAAFADFNARKPPFFDRDLYVFCIDRERIGRANGGFPDLVGRSTDLIKDADGKPLGAALVAAAASGAGSLEYRWQNPATHAVESKISFVHKLGDDVCGVGAYQAK